MTKFEDQLCAELRQPSRVADGQQRSRVIQRHQLVDERRLKPATTTPGYDIVIADLPAFGI
jgi:hypothetical protein